MNALSREAADGRFIQNSELSAVKLKERSRGINKSEQGETGKVGNKERREIGRNKKCKGKMEEREIERKHCR